MTVVTRGPVAQWLIWSYWCLCVSVLAPGDEERLNMALCLDWRWTQNVSLFPFPCGHGLSQLWTEEVDKAEHELRVAQTEFDRQAEVTRLLLEGISSTHVNHLRCLHEFVEAQTAYYNQCHRVMQDLQKELGRFSSSFGRNPGSSPDPAASASSPAASETDVLQIEEVQPPASGTRKAKVLYDYDAADTSEMSLLADELITVYTVPGMDSDWLVGERGNQKGKVPVTYLELLS
ncbi:endophilin-B2-like [Alosa pseudoharengus]|uniref:endophilin-B2-like n=1 Tax=Alosa pseudoharengus TaxID=34774 RepID=UPI003F8AA7C9